MAPNLPPSGNNPGIPSPGDFSRTVKPSEAKHASDVLSNLLSNLDKFKNLASLAPTLEAFKASLAGMKEADAGKVLNRLGAAQGEIIEPARALSSQFVELSSILASVEKELDALAVNIKLAQKSGDAARVSQAKDAYAKKAAERPAIESQLKYIAEQRKGLLGAQNAFREAAEKIQDRIGLASTRGFKDVNADYFKATGDKLLDTVRSKGLIGEQAANAFEKLADRYKGKTDLVSGLGMAGAALGGVGLLGKLLVDAFAGAIRANIVMAPSMLRTYGGVGTKADEGILKLEAGSRALNSFAKATFGLVSQGEMAAYMGVLNDSVLFSPTKLAMSGKSISGIGSKFGELSGKMMLAGTALGMTASESSKFFGTMLTSGIADVNDDAYRTGDAFGALDKAFINSQKVMLAQGGTLNMAVSAYQNTMGLTRKFGMTAQDTSNMLASSLGTMLELSVKGDDTIKQMLRRPEWRQEAVDSLFKIGAGIDAITTAGYNIAAGKPAGVGGKEIFGGGIYENLAATPLQRLTSYMEAIATNVGANKDIIASAFLQKTGDNEAAKILTDIVLNPTRFKAFKELGGAEELAKYGKEFSLSDNSIDKLSKTLLATEDPLKAITTLLTNIAQSTARMASIMNLTPFSSKR